MDLLRLKPIGQSSIISSMYEINFPKLMLDNAVSRRKRLGAHLPPLRSRVRVSVTPCEFRGVRNGIWVGLSRGVPFFPTTHSIPAFLHSYLIHFVQFRFISPCVSATGVIGRHPLRHRSFSNPSSASPKSQDLHLRHLASRPCLRRQLGLSFVEF